ncbi:hypothetical protein F4604DRAFT_1490995, partial [Suillus subluteus]
CDWTDQPCGLFVEVDKIRIEDHLWCWHGVKKRTLCQFKDCSDVEVMIYLSRHIKSIHFEVDYQCPYCKRMLSRADSMGRHQKVCKPLLASRA